MRTCATIMKPTTTKNKGILKKKVLHLQHFYNKFYGKFLSLLTI